MKEKGSALPIIIVIVIILGILAYVGYQYVSKNLKISHSATQEKSDLFKKPEEVKNQMATLIPERQADFIKDGRLHLSSAGQEMENWTFFYEELGNPAIIATLDFNNRSKCDYGQGEQICSEKHFENGMRVHIEGIKNGTDITILNLKVIE